MMGEKPMSPNELSNDELNLLRALRKSPHREDLFMLANMIGVKCDRAELLINKLVSSGYVQQDRRDEINGFHHGYTYFTSANKRVEIDALLEWDFNCSIMSMNDIDCMNADLDDKTFICLKCKTVYKSNFKICKNCLHSIIEIDTKILDTILELNRKGYPTAHCCCGHVKNLVSAAQIVMAGVAVIESIPEGFSKEDRNGTIVYRAVRLIKRLKKKDGAIINDDDINKIKQFINSDMDNLREWVETLKPPNHLGQLDPELI